MKTWLVTVAVLVAVLGFAWFEWQPWIGSQDGTSQAAVAQTEPIGDGVMASNGDVPVAVPAAGSERREDHLHRQIRARLSPVNYTVIASEIDAKVASLPFRDGESFAMGEILITLDCDLQHAKLERAQAELEIAERNARANATLVQRGSVSRLDADNSVSERNRMQAQVRELAIQVSRCEIRAPYAGKLVDRLVRQEQFVQVGQPLLEILDDSRLEFEFIVPSRWMSWIEVGFPFKVVVEETGQTYPAQIDRVGARIDAVSQTIRVVGAIDGHYQELMSGMSGVVDIGVPMSRVEVTK